MSVGEGRKGSGRSPEPSLAVTYPLPVHAPDGFNVSPEDGLLSRFQFPMAL